MQISLEGKVAVAIHAVNPPSKKKNGH